MKNDWLTASSFERAHEIVNAINTLSIHAKLALARVADPGDPIEVETARTKLRNFLDKLDLLMQSAENDQTKIIVGTDPRFGELALQYMTEKRRLPPRSRLYTLSITELGELVQSEQIDDMEELVECLESLRLMLEQYAQTDVAGIFGDE